MPKLEAAPAGARNTDGHLTTALPHRGKTMATRDCNEARQRGLRRYPQRLPCSPYPRSHVAALAVREVDTHSDSGDELLGRFSDARCLLQCAVNSLMARDEGGFYSPELVCLRHGMELLRSVYNDLDLRLLREPSRLGG